MAAPRPSVSTTPAAALSTIHESPALTSSLLSVPAPDSPESSPGPRFPKSPHLENPSAPGSLVDMIRAQSAFVVRTPLDTADAEVGPSPRLRERRNSLPEEEIRLTLTTGISYQEKKKTWANSREVFAPMAGRQHQRMFADSTPNSACASPAITARELHMSPAVGPSPRVLARSLMMSGGIDPNKQTVVLIPPSPLVQASPRIQASPLVSNFHSPLLRSSLLGSTPSMRANLAAASQVRSALVSAAASNLRSFAPQPNASSSSSESSAASISSPAPSLRTSVSSTPSSAPAPADSQCSPSFGLESPGVFRGTLTMGASKKPAFPSLLTSTPSSSKGLPPTPAPTPLVASGHPSAAAPAGAADKDAVHNPELISSLNQLSESRVESSPARALSTSSPSPSLASRSGGGMSMVSMMRQNLLSATTSHVPSTATSAPAPPALNTSKPPALSTNTAALSEQLSSMTVNNSTDSSSSESS